MYSEEFLYVTLLPLQQFQLLFSYSNFLCEFLSIVALDNIEMRHASSHLIYGVGGLVFTVSINYAIEPSHDFRLEIIPTQ